MRNVLLAYHDIGAVCLEELLATGDEIALVITHEDPVGENVWYRSVRELAERHEIAVIAPPDVNAPDVVERVVALEPDFLFSAMFRQMLKPPLLEAPRRGALNLHPSLLPKFRGRAPINWVLVEGETETGVTLHYMREREGSRNRYFQDDEEAMKLVPEGIEGRVPYKGPVTFIIQQLIGGLKAGMGYVGCATLRELRTKTKFVRVTSAGFRESHVHDVSITKEAPNYRLE